jgi:hypothetical protein
MPLAVEQIRRMRGGAQSHLMRCAAEDNEYYVVKFQNNPQGVKILANELLGTTLAARIGLPVPAAAVVEVRRELIDQTDDLVMQLGRGRAPCRAGFQFGSRYPGRPQETVVYDFLPEEHLRSVSNLADFCGMLVFDKWTCNTNGRQAIFLCSAEGAPYRTQMSYGAQMPYRAQMIDQGFCFNAGEWSFPDAPLRGLGSTHGTAYTNRCAAWRRLNRGSLGSKVWTLATARKRPARFRRIGTMASRMRSLRCWRGSWRAARWCAT